MPRTLLSCRGWVSTHTGGSAFVHILVDDKCQHKELLVKLTIWHVWIKVFENNAMLSKHAVLPSREDLPNPIKLFIMKVCKLVLNSDRQVLDCLDQDSAQGHRAAKPSEFNFSIILPIQLWQLTAIFYQSISLKSWKKLQEGIAYYNSVLDELEAAGFLIKTMIEIIITVVNDQLW